MSRVLTNNTSLAVAIEASLGALPVSPVWHLLEPNSITKGGADITTVARAPISKSRQRRKGTITDLDSAVEYDADTTMSQLVDSLEGFCFARRTGLVSGPLHLTSAENALAATSATSGYTYTSITGSAVPAGRLVFARGFATSANNGLKVVLASSTDAKILVAGLTTEAPSVAQNATVDVCGVRGASGDIQLNGSGNLIATTLDFTTLGLTVGQFIKIGGAVSANQFATAAYNGTARVVSVAAGLVVLDKRSWTVAAADTGTGKLIDVYFGPFIRNVTVDHADFIERSFQFEITYVNLDNPSGDMYEYCRGNLANKIGVTLPLTNKATITVGYIGTDTAPPSATRATNASTPARPVMTGAFNTSADIARLRIRDSLDADLGSYFKSLTTTLNNNVSPEKVLGTLGAAFMNTGNFEVDIEAQLLFTDADIVSAIRNNDTVTMDWMVQNDDGGIVFDIPSMTVGGGGREFPVNQSVLINTTAQAFEDATLGYSLGISLFAYLP